MGSESPEDNVRTGVDDSGDIEVKVDALATRSLDVGQLICELRNRFDDDWESERLTVDPALFVSDNRQPGVKMCRYKHWMGLPKHGSGYISPKQHVTLMRFRMCVWPLAVNRPHGRERSARWCRVCGNRQAVEDECHVLLDCPAYANIRLKLWDLGVTPGDRMIEIMGVKDQRGLARVLDDIRRCRLQYVED